MLRALSLVVNLQDYELGSTHPLLRPVIILGEENYLITPHTIIIFFSPFTQFLN
jgi:hypothetical protein